jgi:hypothetical protein
MSSLIDLFLDLANLNDNFESEYIELSNLYQNEPKLYCKNGLSWARSDGDLCKKYKIFTIYDNINKNTEINENSILFRWNIDEDEKEFYINDISEKINSNELQFPTNRKTNRYIKVCGKIDEDNNNSRSIRQDIKNFYKNKSCVSCGTTSSIECDHKNGLLNDQRVLNIHTQTIDDFQPLCSHCNKVKRESIKKMKNEHKRQSIKLIPQFEHYIVDFISGNEIYNENDINAMVGTYWYDPKEFQKKYDEIFKYNLVNNLL